MNAMPGALMLVRELHVAGIPMAVASSSFRKDVQASLRTVGLASMLPMLATGDEVEHTKPAPDLYLLAARRLGLSPSQCIAFEDTQTGLRAAHAAGVPCIAVPNHYSRHHDFSLATQVLNSLEEIGLSTLKSLIIR
jgi:HAD superfamily hydrolase (TIGR01509 family)